MSMCTSLHDWTDDGDVSTCAQCGATDGGSQYDSTYDTIWERDE